MNNTDTPLISIITVCFNSAKTIRRTIESVLNQTYTNIEYILVDGKSKDNTVAIIEEYEPQFAQRGITYRWVSEPDKGIYDAMNNGIKMANGEWIGIINSDDWYELDACENIVMHTMNHDVVYGVQKFWSSDHQLIQILQNHHTQWLTLTMAHSSIFIKKILYVKYGFFDLNYKLAADYKLCVNLTMQNNIKFKMIDNIITNFQQGGASSNNSYIDSNFESLKIRFYFGNITYFTYLLQKIKLVVKKSRQAIWKE